MNIVVSVGDINGIGPEIALKGFQTLSDKSDKFYYFAPYNVFIETYKQQGCNFSFKTINLSEIDKINTSILQDTSVVVIDLGECSQKVGVPTKESGHIAFQSLTKALQFMDIQKSDFLITAPLSKEAFKLAEIDFVGHTEILAKWCNNSKDFIMMFLSENMKCALVTIHEPLSKVSQLITHELIELKIRVIKQSLMRDFRILNPRIAILGLNPHAGENGLLGTEENSVLLPIIEKNKDILYGPFPSDAFFGTKQYSDYDLVLAMYHDQGLIPFKMLNFNNGVNFTAGLPIIRTSPDHGTAFNIAGLNIASSESFLSSYYYGRKIKENRDKYEA